MIRTQASIYPVLLSSVRDPDLPILGYRDLRASAGVERSIYWKVHGALTHNVQVNDPFTYLGQLDPDLDTVWVSYPELFLRLDARATIGSSRPREPTPAPRSKSPGWAATRATSSCGPRRAATSRFGRRFTLAGRARRRLSVPG